MRVKGTEPTRSAGIALGGDDDLNVAQALVVENETGPFAAVLVEPEIVQEIRPERATLVALTMEPARQDLIGIDLVHGDRCRHSSQCLEARHASAPRVRARRADGR